MPLKFKMTAQDLEEMTDGQVHELYLAQGLPEHSVHMTGTEVAKVFRVGPKTVNRWSDEGKIGVFRTPGNHRRYYRTDVERHVLTEMINSEIYLKAIEIISG